MPSKELAEQIFMSILEAEKIDIAEELKGARAYGNGYAHNDARTASESTLRYRQSLKERFSSRARSAMHIALIAEAAFDEVQESVKSYLDFHTNNLNEFKAILAYQGTLALDDAVSMIEYLVSQVPGSKAPNGHPVDTVVGFRSFFESLDAENTVPLGFTHSRTAEQRDEAHVALRSALGTYGPVEPLPQPQKT